MIGREIAITADPNGPGSGRPRLAAADVLHGLGGANAPIAAPHRARNPLWDDYHASLRSGGGKRRRPYILAALATLAALAAAIGAADAFAADLPPAPRLEFAFEELVLLGPAVQAGRTGLGERTMIPITGGTFEGPGIKGTIIPGGWDWQLRRADGCTQIKADYMLRTDDGVVINVVNTGALCGTRDGKPAPVRTHPVFEPPVGKYEWLGQSAFIGTLDIASVEGKPAVRIRFYKAV